MCTRHRVKQYVKPYNGKYSTYPALCCQGYPSAQCMLTKACLHQVAVSRGAQSHLPSVPSHVKDETPAWLSSQGRGTSHPQPQWPMHPCIPSCPLHTACTCTPQFVDWVACISKLLFDSSMLVCEFKSLHEGDDVRVCRSESAVGEPRPFKCCIRSKTDKRRSVRTVHA